MKWRELVVWFIAVSLSAGCATVSLAPQSQDGEAKLLIADPGKTKIYIARAGGVGSALIFFSSLDGQELGPLAPNTYQVVATEPGRHVLTILGQANQQSLVLEGKPDELIFVRVDVHLGWSSGRAHAEIVDSKTGQAIVRDSKRAKQLEWDSKSQ